MLVEREDWKKKKKQLFFIAVQQCAESGTYADVQYIGSRGFFVLWQHFFVKV